MLVSLTQVFSAELIQPVSIPSPNQIPSAGGNRDSCLPVLSEDGRFVLFASTANNLVLASNNIPIPSLVPARFNVYLRDRTNQTTVLVSRSTNGVAGGNGDSFPVALSTNGQFALFESSASNLVAGDTNNAADVVLRDLNSGELSLVSISTNGLPGNGASRSAVMTPDGRYIAFVSEASNLVPGDSNRIADVFLRDRQALITTLVSVGARSTTTSLVPPNSSESPQITPDARYIAFFSSATNLVAGVQTIWDIYVHDRIAGTNIWASSGMRAILQSVTGQTNGFCHNLALSANGKYVAYQASRTSQPAGTVSGIILRYDLESGLTDLVHTNAPTSIPSAVETRNLDLTPDGGIIAFVANSNGVSGATTCVQVWNAASGITTLASGDLTNNVTTGSISTHPVLDSSGHFVTYLSSATGLVTNTLSGAWHLYVRDLLNSTTTLANADASGAGSTLTAVSVPSLSADVRFVAFEGEDGSLAANDNNRALDVFVRDLAAGTNELISVAHPTLASATPNGMSLLSPFPASADGRYIAYASDADNLVPGDTNGFRDVFVRDLASGTNLLVSAAPNGASGNGISSEPAMSGNGRYVAFRSTATNLVAGDANNVADIFVRDLQTGITLLASQANSAGTAPGNAHSPSLSADGRWLLFRSQAVGTSVESGTLFLRDMQLATNWVLTTASFVTPVMTPNGRFVAFVGPIPGNFLSYLYLWDSSLGARVLTNATTSINGITISPDGNLLAYNTPTQLRLVDRAIQTNWLVSAMASASLPSPRFSADGNWLAYSRFESPWHQVFLYDVHSRTEHLVSHVPGGSAGSGGHSDLPNLTPDGRFVVYRTLATNVVVGGNGIARQIILYDRQTGVNTLVSASRFTGGPADDHSQRAVFSADGQTLLLQSWASDLATGDFNFSGDVLATTIFTAMILPSSTPGEGPWLSWPILPGGNYRVQFKNDLSDPNWQNLPGTPATLGVKAWLQDSTLDSSRRIYRVISY